MSDDLIHISDIEKNCDSLRYYEILKANWNGFGSVCSSIYLRYVLVTGKEAKIYVSVDKQFSLAFIYQKHLLITKMQKVFEDVKLINIFICPQEEI